MHPIHEDEVVEKIWVEYAVLCLLAERRARGTLFQQWVSMSRKNISEDKPAVRV